MNSTEILDGLYDVRDQLTRLISVSTDQDAVQRLLTERDRITWRINEIIDGDLDATMAQCDAICADLDDATKKLKALSGTLADIGTAIQIVKQVSDAVGAVITTVTA